jgi:hypothetical protein
VKESKTKESKTEALSISNRRESFSVLEGFKEEEKEGPQPSM